MRNAEARDAVPQHRIKQRYEQCSCQRDEPGMKAETPVGIRERAYPGPGPQEPEALDGVDSQKKQCEEKNSAKNQEILRI